MSSLEHEIAKVADVHCKKAVSKSLLVTNCIWDTENIWEKNFEAVEAFCDKLGTFAFLRNMSVKLASSSGRGFINNALFCNKENHSYLDADRIKRLERIGMTWRPQRKASITAKRQWTISTS